MRSGEDEEWGKMRSGEMRSGEMRSGEDEEWGR